MRANMVLLAAMCAVALAEDMVAKTTNTSSPVADTSTSDTSKSPALGFIGVAFAAVGFGSNFVVIKKYDAGDGMFFQFVMCVGIFFTGFIFYLIKGAPPIQPPAMLGGVQWAIGNAMCPFIIESIGMGLGLSVWGAINMLSGWSGAHFGWFGLSKQTVTHNGLNIAGAIVAAVSVLVYAQVKTASAGSDEDVEEIEAGDQGNQVQRSRIESQVSKGSSKSTVSYSAGAMPMGGVVKADAAKDAGKPSFLLGVIMACIAGVLFGTSFNPAQVVTDYAANHHCHAIKHPDECGDAIWHKGRTYCKWDNDADDGKKCGGMPQPDMCFTQFIGIFITSMLIFVGYGLIKMWKGRSSKHPEETILIADGSAGQPFVNVPLILPGMLSGMIWAVAQIGWFIANDNLSMTIAFPIVCATPAIIGNMWGIFVFNEVVRTPKNLGVLCFGMVLSIVAGLLVSISK